MSEVAAIVSYLRSRVTIQPEVAIVCGSGLSGLANLVEDAVTIEYTDIPHFPRSTVEGHGNVLVFGTLEGKKVVVMKGRFHFYEGYKPTDVSIGVRVFAALGVKVLLVTNAAGGVNADYKVGDVMVINDHISFPGLAGIHPLVGHNDKRFGDRFFPMTNAYTPELRALVAASAAELPAGTFTKTLRQGVYVNVSGPSYETRAEIGMMRIVGGDAVGMSTAFEVLEAAHAGMQVVGLSLITNECVAPGDNKIPPVHAEVLAVAEEAKPGFTALVRKVVHKMDTGKYAVPVAAAEFAGAGASAGAASAAAAPAAGGCCSGAAAKPVAASSGCGCGAGCKCCVGGGCKGCGTDYAAMVGISAAVAALALGVFYVVHRRL